MLHRITYSLLLILFSFSSSFPQSIKKIVVEGNSAFTETEILQWAQATTSLLVYPGLIDSIKKRLAFNFSNRGYLNSNFDGIQIEPLSDSTFVNLIINFTEGEPTYINNIFIEREDSSLIDFNSYFDFLKGQIFNKYSLEESINEALTFAENNSYPFIKIKIEGLDFYNDSSSEDHFVDINLLIDNGQKSAIDKIEVKGNTSTKDYVITRELRISEGEEYSQAMVEELPNRLNRLRYFEPVATPQFLINAQKEGVLLIEVKEKQTNNFDGIIGYIPAAKEGEKGYVTGLVNISLRNLFGTGRAAAFHWQQFNRFSQDIEIKYLEPWLLGYPFNINGTLYQRKQDTTYVQRKLEGNLEYLATEDISAAVLVGTESIIPSQNANKYTRIFNSSILTTGVNLKIDTRDDPYAPKGGVLFINSYSLSRKKLIGPQEFITPDLETNINLQRFTFSFWGFYELFTNQIIAVGLTGKELRGSFFEESDLFRLGGNNSLRGYREEQFLGSRVAWSNLEYRFLLTRRSYAFAFFDTGYYLRNEDAERNILKNEDFNIGYGIGLSIETGLGVLGVSFALAKGDSFSDGKIHFGIINEF